MAQNQFSTLLAGTRDTYIDNIDKLIDVLWMRRDEVAPILGRYFDRINIPNGDSFKISNVGSVAGLPRLNEDVEDLPYVNPATGFAKTFTLRQYRVATRFTDTFLKVDRQGKAAAMAGGLPTASMRLEEFQRAAIFDNGHSGTDGSDSLSLFNDSHPQENPEAGTYDNKGTGVLTGDNLQALRLLARNMTNEDGSPDPVNPVDLLVPNDLEQKANELVGSTLKAEDSLNAKTVLIPSLNVVVSPFLTSAVQYVITGDRQGEQKGMHEIFVIPWNMENNPAKPYDIAIDKRIKAMFVIGFTRTRNLFGSTGA